MDRTVCSPNFNGNMLILIIHLIECCSNLLVTGQIRWPQLSLIGVLRTAVHNEELSQHGSKSCANVTRYCREANLFNETSSSNARFLIKWKRLSLNTSLPSADHLMWSKGWAAHCFHIHRDKTRESLPHWRDKYWFCASPLSLLSSI